MTDNFSAEVRAWARSRGIQVGARGRVAPSIIAAYMRSMEETPASNVRVVSQNGPVTVTYGTGNPPAGEAS
jgi:hypothetical protein